VTDTPRITELAAGIRRVTLPLPLGMDHVHCYLLRGASGWTLVDTGLGEPGAAERWRGLLAGLDAPLERVVITHFHVDHIGAAADVAPLSRDGVLEGRLGRQQSLAHYDGPAWGEELQRHLVRHGMPEAEALQAHASWRAIAALARPAPQAAALDPGDLVDGWEVVALPGHADGHIGLLRDGVLVGGDALLPDVSPTIGVWPGAADDPLADYLDTLERIAALDPALVLPAHGNPVTDPAGRARELAEHHARRLDAVGAALGPAPATAYDVSRVLWPDGLDAAGRSLAVAEALAHLERLVGLGRARADRLGEATRFSPPAPPR
jgi:glyoxylase-like metal-dependent hydrolase (beta-lactamase superfamily II)